MQHGLAAAACFEFEYSVHFLRILAIYPPLLGSEPGFTSIRIVPSPMNPPPGCAFHTRCPYAEARCKIDVPALREVSSGHMVACHLR